MREQVLLTKHQLGDGVILMVFNPFHALTLYIYINANQINISANTVEN